jgi:hypothetical protein
MTARYEVVITPAEETFEKRPLYSLWKREKIQSGPCEGLDTNTLVCRSYDRRDLFEEAAAVWDAVISFYRANGFSQPDTEE